MEIKNGANTTDIIQQATAAGFDFSKFTEKFYTILNSYKPLTSISNQQYPVLIVGGGAAGISVATSLLKRRSDLDIAIIDPAEQHYYQPGFTMVGGGIFSIKQTCRTMASVMPKDVTWIKAAATEFKPDDNIVILATGEKIQYERLIVCPGLKLNLDGIKGLKETLGKNGVTTNYLPEYAPYTWELVRTLEEGKALFTQPAMPIKCAGAPQKALYLAGDCWFKKRLLQNISVEFYNAGGVLFGVKEFVPALQSYIDKYKAQVHFNHNLISIDGNKKLATFQITDSEGNKSEMTTDFDMIHVCPPQTAPDFIRNSPLADASGWVDVDQSSLRHKSWNNIWALGDCANAPNAKTAAAVRKQAPVVACNIIADMEHTSTQFAYDGYGACPLTVERGKIVLAEFSYGGKLAPSLPTWLLNGTRPTRLAWFLKKSVMPALYWFGMLKGRETLVKPEVAKENTE